MSRFLEQPKNAARWLLVAGALTFITWTLMLVMAGDNPKPATYPNNHGFQSAILWFELAASPQEIFLILGSPSDEAGRKLRSVMDAMNKFDYGFMVGYSALNASLFFFVRALNRSRSRRIFIGSVAVIVGLCLTLAMYVGDVMENVQLLKLTGYADAASVSDAVISSLSFWTRVKWVAIFVAALLLGVGYSSYFGKSIGLILGFLYTTTGLLGLFAMVLPDSLAMLEYASAMVGLCWLISLFHGVAVVREKV